MYNDRIISGKRAQSSDKTDRCCFFKSKLIVIQLTNQPASNHLDSCSQNNQQILVTALSLNQHFFYGLVNYVRLYKAFRLKLYKFLFNFYSQTKFQVTNRLVKNDVFPCHGMLVKRNENRSISKARPAFLLQVVNLDPHDRIVRAWFVNYFLLNNLIDV
jgi:hypothetical protein